MQGDSLSVSPQVEGRLEEEFRLIRRHHLAGFLLLYREIVLIAQEIMEKKGMMRPETPCSAGLSHSPRPHPGNERGELPPQAEQASRHHALSQRFP